MDRVDSFGSPRTPESCVANTRVATAPPLRRSCRRQEKSSIPSKLDASDLVWDSLWKVLQSQGWINEKGTYRGPRSSHQVFQSKEDLVQFMVSSKDLVARNALEAYCDKHAPPPRPSTPLCNPPRLQRHSTSSPRSPASPMNSSLNTSTRIVETSKRKQLETKGPERLNSKRVRMDSNMAVRSRRRRGGHSEEEEKRQRDLFNFIWNVLKKDRAWQHGSGGVLHNFKYLKPLAKGEERVDGVNVFYSEEELIQHVSDNDPDLFHQALLHQQASPSSDQNSTPTQRKVHCGRAKSSNGLHSKKIDSTPVRLNQIPSPAETPFPEIPQSWNRLYRRLRKNNNQSPTFEELMPRLEEAGWTQGRPPKTRKSKETWLYAPGAGPHTAVPGVTAFETFEAVAEFWMREMQRQEATPIRPKEQSKRDPQDDGISVKTTSTHQSKKTPSKLFPKLWKGLTSRGWRRVKGKGGSFYLMPGVMKSTGKIGVDMFSTQHQVVQFCMENGEDVTEANGKQQPQAKHRVHKDDNDESDEDMVFMGMSDVDEFSLDGESDSEEETLTFKEIWRILAKRGWTYGSGDLLSTHVYLKPNVRKRDGILGETMFSSEEQVVKYWQDMGRYESDEQQEQSSDQLAGQITSRRRSLERSLTSTPIRTAWDEMQACGWTSTTVDGEEFVLTPAASSMDHSSLQVDGFNVFSSLQEAVARFKLQRSSCRPKNSNHTDGGHEELSDEHDDDGESSKEKDIENPVSVNNMDQQDIGEEDIEEEEDDEEEEEEEEEEEDVIAEYRSIVSSVAALQKEWIGREEEVSKLVSLLGTSRSRTPNIVVFGDTSTGKTAVTSSLLRRRGANHCMIDCQLCYTPGVLFENILCSLPPQCDDGLDSTPYETSLEEEDVEKEEGREAEDYEAQRQKNIQENEAFLAKLFQTDNASTHAATEGEGGNKQDEKEKMAQGEVESHTGHMTAHQSTRRRLRASEKYHDFVLTLKERLESLGWEKSSFYIVLDNADILYQRFPHLFSCFLRIGDELDCNVTPILLSTRLPRRMEDQLIASCCSPVYFSQYDQSVAQKLLEDSLMKNESLSGFLSRPCLAQFCRLVLDSLWLRAKDLRELRRVAEELLQYWCMRIGDKHVSGPVTSLDEHRSMLLSCIKKIALRLYHHDFDLQSETEFNPANDSWTEEEKHTLISSTEIPYNSKVLLIAGFLASFNPPDADRKLFASSKSASVKEKRRKARRNATKLSAIPQTQLGPRKFKLERLFYIYRTLLAMFQDSGSAFVSFHNDMYRHLSTLESAGLLARVSSQDDLNNVQLKCTASRDYVAAIADSVTGFSLDDFLVLQA